jgi:hypothetical protein
MPYFLQTLQKKYWHPECMKVAFFLCPACIIRNFGKSGRINGDLKDYKTMKRNDRVSIKIIVLGKITRIRASPRHGGQGSFS